MTTNDAELADSVRSCATTAGAATTCRARPQLPPLRHPLRGRDPAGARLAELHAARASLAAAYAERLRDLPVLLPRADDGDVHGWQAYVVQVDGRDDVLARPARQGIEAQIGTYALHRLGAYRDQGPFPGADRAFERALALPFHSRLTDEDLDGWRGT